MCTNLSSPRGYGVGLGVLDALVFAGGFKGNSNLDAIDVWNTTSRSWSHARMSTGRTLFDGAALGHTAIFGCGEGAGGGTADVLDVRTLGVRTVQLKGGSRKKCAAAAVVLGRDAAGNPTDGKILIGGGYKSTAVDVWDLRTGAWTVTHMSQSHFYMAAASAGDYALFCGGLAADGDTDLCDMYDARADTWSTGRLARPVREIAATSVSGVGGELAVFLGGGQSSVFNASAKPPTWTYRVNLTAPTCWSKMGRATVRRRFAVFAGGNGNCPTIELYDAATGQWAYARHNLSFGREQVMGAGTTSGAVAFAGGECGNYKPTGYTARVDAFTIDDLIPPRWNKPHPPPPPPGCGPGTDPGDCAGLVALAKSTDSAKWQKNTHWLDPKKPVCDWHGVNCSRAGRVVALSLKENNLQGAIPPEIGRITELEAFDMQGGRPTDYVGCQGNNLRNSSLPPEFFTLTKLTDVNMEYTCLGGTLAGFSKLTALTSLQLHGNYITGSIPADLEALTEVRILKLGRNPISGTLPKMAFKHVIQFNCNFCALSGPFPDMFDGMPEIEVSYWDGNGFNGSLPPSVGRAKKLQRLSFNINQFTGPIPPAICNIPAGDGGNTPDTAHDCRIGADTDLKAYQADRYPWIIRGHGNLFDCNGIPPCAAHGSCNKTKGTKVVNPVSPVRCQ